MTEEEESAKGAGSMSTEAGLQVLGRYPWRLVHLCWDLFIGKCEKKHDYLAKYNIHIWLKKRDKYDGSGI